MLTINRRNQRRPMAGGLRLTATGKDGEAVRLPYEDKLRALIRNRLEPELKTASAILDLGTTIYTSGTPMKPGKGLDDFVVIVALGMVAKACKQYRAIGEMVELGLGEVADSNSRMLFETMLATHFILRPRVVLKRDGKKLAAVKGKPLTTKFRTSLYLASAAFSGKKLANGLLATPGLKRQMSKEARAEILKQATEWETEIGPDWTKRLREGYAGVKIVNLAESLGYAPLYHSVYRIASGGVHAGDATGHIRLDDDPKAEWRFQATPSTDGIANTLKFASLLMIKILEVADDRLGLGLKQRKQRLLAEVERMRIDFPES
jgi:Family of unknown function (DUF5677)